jgi:cellulose synthase/poly-beta-1,6-N-acetylglucosamine synthase-like glycosyltransferase
MFIYDLIKYNGRIPFESVMHGVVFYVANIIGFLFLLVYLHQLMFLVIGSFNNHKFRDGEVDVKLHKLGIVIPARNESRVIAELIKSVQANDYPKEYLKIFVIADNCTDNTAEIARNMGCTVFERFDKTKVGKGYTLNWFWTKLHTEAQYADLVPEAYIIFDADNVVKSNFITEINKTYSAGYEIITSYRNSKNIGKNWISSGYGLWFLHEARHLNNCRMMLGSSCAISGTGFLITTNVLKEFDNWNFFTLTEDIQCSAQYAISGRKIGYCGQAELYDEQPVTFRQSWRQRERWAKGFYQVLGRYGGGLFKNSFFKFACWDIITTIFPALFLTLAMIFSFGILSIVCVFLGDTWTALYAAQCIVSGFLFLYVLTFLIGLFTTVTEWNKIKMSTFKKFFYLFTFPLFMVTYLPIAIVALFRKRIEWKPIVHEAKVSIEELDEGK